MEDAVRYSLSWRSDLCVTRVNICRRGFMPRPLASWLFGSSRLQSGLLQLFVSASLDVGKSAKAHRLRPVWWRGALHFRSKCTGTSRVNAIDVFSENGIWKKRMRLQQHKGSESWACSSEKMRKTEKKVRSNEEFTQ